MKKLKPGVHAGQGIIQNDTTVLPPTVNVPMPGRIAIVVAVATFQPFLSLSLSLSLPLSLSLSLSLSSAQPLNKLGNTHTHRLQDFKHVF